MPELGGDIPLETCLAETREAGYSGTELGGKFPRTSSALGPILAAASSEAGIRLVRRPHPGARRGRGVRCHHPASDAAAGSRLHRSWSMPIPRAAADGFPPISQRPALADDDWPAYGRKVTRWPNAWRRSASAWRSITTWARSCRPTRDRPADGQHRRGGGAAVRYRPLSVRRWRSRGAAGAPRARVVHVHCKDVRRMCWSAR